MLDRSVTNKAPSFLDKRPHKNWRSPTRINAPSGASHSRGASSLQKFGGVFSRIAVTEYGTARDEQVSARAHDIANGLEINPTIHFNAESQAA